MASVQQSKAYSRLQLIATLSGIGAVIAIVIALIVNANGPNIFLADALDVLEHAGQVNAWFTVAGALIGAAFIAIVAQLSVNAVLDGMADRVKGQTPPAPASVDPAP